MDSGILQNIPFEPNPDTLLKRLRIKEGSPYQPEVLRVVQEATRIANPKAAYKAGYIEAKNHDTVVINGNTFTSRVLRVNLEDAQRVFVYLATCGTELEEWSKGFDDLIYQYWADVLREMALRCAAQALEAHLEGQYQLGKTASMSPGSLEDWPITEQKPLFALVGELSKAIGVQLNESCLMIPVKSISGLRFPTETRFESCQLCQRPNCPGRRAQYDPHLYKQRFS